MNIPPHKMQYGVLGSPVRHSLSPELHNYAFRELDIRAEYGAFEVTPATLGNAITGMRALGIRGFNCTIPLKEHVHKFVDAVHPDAEIIGAINTIDNRDGTLTGYNTDIEGFLRTLGGREAGWAQATVVLFGAGGTTRAILYALQKYTAVNRIVIVNRTPARAEALAELGSGWGNSVLEVLPLDDHVAVSRSIREAVAVVNTTSLGLAPHDETTPVADATCFHGNLIAVDMVYNPLDTCFLQLARAAGAAAVGGLDMLIYQGAASFRIWLEQEMPTDKVREHLLQFV